VALLQFVGGSYNGLHMDVATDEDNVRLPKRCEDSVFNIPDEPGPEADAFLVTELYERRQVDGRMCLVLAASGQVRGQRPG
jgi:hypothetical protein